MGREEILVERCPSGIPGFDDLCEGGFVRNSVNALLGGPGAGKTIFMLQFLHNGAVKYNENGMYVSFEPDIVEIFKDASIFSWDMEKLEKTGKCSFIKIAPDTDVNELKKDLMSKITKYQIKRICIDPISLFKTGEANEAKIRLILFDMASMLKRLGVTIVLADEASSEEGERGEAAQAMRSKYIQFLVDGLVNLYSSGLGGISDRAVRVAKMRRTNHARGPVPMQITDAGISVLVQKGKRGIL